METKKLIKTSIIGFIIPLFIIIFNPLYIITSGSKGLIFKFGAIQNKEIEAGIHLKLPIVENIKIVSIQPQKLEYEVIVGNDGAITKDNQTIGASTIIFYKFKANNLVSLYQDYGIDNMKNIIQATVKDSIKATMGNYTIFDIAGNQNKITDGVTKELRTKLANYPIEITELKITNYDWSDDFDTQIKETMNKAQQVKQKEQDLLISEQEAQKQVKQAEAQKQALIIEAEGKKESAKLNAEAKALEGEGIKKYNESIATNLDVQLKLKQLDIEQAKIEKWNGAYVSNNNYMPIPYNNGIIQGK